MSRKVLVLGLILALAAVTAAPASAKKKKGPKPYKSEIVTVEFGHPMFHGNSGSLVGITPQEFLNTCAIPGTNGIDAYVFEVPAEYQKIQSVIDASGVGTTDGAVAADIDIYLFDEACAFNGVFNTAGTSESGVLAAGTKYVLLHNYTGGPTDLGFTLKPY